MALQTLQLEGEYRPLVDAGRCAGSQAVKHQYTIVCRMDGWDRFVMTTLIDRAVSVDNFG